MFTVDCTNEGFDSYFQCHDGDCLVDYWECDDYEDCDGGEDELNCHGECVLQNDLKLICLC